MVELKDITDLKEDSQKISQFHHIKVVTHIIDDPLNKAAAIWMDWSENAKISNAGKKKSRLS